ncbi:MAG: prefoldin subunit [Nanoarchaeota archaeon]|nr:prefoldin subunit [Nanoarchaeota archaeon]
MEKDKIQKMQFFQENLNAILMQKQAFSMELNETISALKEIKNSKEDVYKIIGQLMLKVPKEKIEDELNSKEKLIKMRLEKLEIQEEKLSEETKKIREEILKENKKN